MHLLALDTSTERLCLALCVHGEVFPHEEPGGARASQRLLPAAQALLGHHGLTWRDLNGLGWGQGPGAFTGLRGSCAAVQGLALGLGLQAVAIPSLRVVAEDARQQGLRSGMLSAREPCTVWVALDARMAQVYDDQATWDGQRWHGVQGPAVRSPLEVADAWRAGMTALGPSARAGTSPPLLLCAGTGLELMDTETAEGLKAHGALWLPHEFDRSTALGLCMLEAWAHGARSDAAQVMPLYVRDRVALTTAEREGQPRGDDREGAPLAWPASAERRVTP